MNQINEREIELRDDDTGAGFKEFDNSETVTWSSGTTKDTTADLLPANSIIDAVLVEVVEAIAGTDATAFSVGDATTAGRFATGVAKTLGAQAIGLLHWAAATQAQAAAAKVRLTATGGTPTAATGGQVKVTVRGRTFYAPDTV